MRLSDTQKAVAVAIAMGIEQREITFPIFRKLIKIYEIDVKDLVDFWAMNTGIYLFQNAICYIEKLKKQNEIRHLRKCLQMELSLKAKDIRKMRGLK